MGVGLNSILNRSSVAARNTASSASLMQEINKSYTRLSTGNKYLNLADMDADGIRRTVDSARGELIKIANYETTITITEPKLQAQSKALSDIKAILGKFNPSIGSSSSPLTKAEVSDRALTELAQILNRRNDGEYLFGGKNPTESPLLNDIVTTSNKIDGQITSKYTNATEDMTQIDITDDASVRANRLHAGFSGIQEMIEMLHFYKDPATPQSTIASETFSKYTSVQQSIDRLKLSINTDIELINGTNETNKASLILSNAESVANSKINSITAVDVTQESSNFLALSLSAITNLNIAQSRNNLLSQFAQTLSR